MKKRNHSIDIIKFICACIVIMLHTAFKWHDDIMPLTRCAVPCFFMTSGFLLYSNQDSMQERLKRNIRHICHIILWSTLLFVGYKEMTSLVHGNFYVPSLEQWGCFIVLNENPFVFHLWYLNAYLYVLIVMLAVDKYNLWRYTKWAAPSLLVIGNLLIYKYSVLIWDNPFVFRNFLFMGIPYFAIGAWYKNNNERISAINRNIFGCGIILFAATSIIEENSLIFSSMPPMREHYLSTPFLAVCLFLYVLSFKPTRSSCISRMGEKDSLYIYVFHPLFTLTLPAVVYRMPSFVNDCYQYTAPLIALVLTIAFTITLRKTKLIA